MEDGTTTMFTSNGFYSVVSPTYNITKILGLTPFNINSKGCRTSKASLLWSILFMLFINTYSVIAIKPSGIDEQIIAKLTDALDVYTSQSILCCGLLFGCIFRNEVLITLQEQSVQRKLHCIFRYCVYYKKWRFSIEIFKFYFM